MAYGARLIDKSGDKVIDLARAWGKTLAFVTGMKVHMTVEQELDLQQPYVFMSNHVSSADIWALFSVLPMRVRMIAKKQLGSIPFFGWALRCGRFVFIDRQNPHAARRSIDEAARRIREGVSVLVFPEGTRARDGRLKEFKKGGFHLALTAGVPIVPVVVRGTFDLIPAKTMRIRPGRVEVVLAPPISTAGLTGADREQVLERVHAEIAKRLGPDRNASLRSSPLAVTDLAV